MLPCRILHVFILLFFYRVALSNACVNITTRHSNLPTYASFFCQYDGVKKYPMYWSYNGNIIAWLPDNRSSIIYEKQLYTASLTSLLIQPFYGIQHVGRYSCTFPFQRSCASGTSSTELSLPTNTDFRYGQGQTISLDCEYQEDSISWFKGDSLLTFNGDVLGDVSKITTNGRNLTITNANIDDAGLYTCKKMFYEVKKYIVIVQNIKKDGSVEYIDDLDVEATQSLTEIRFIVKNIEPYEYFYILKDGKVIMMLRKNHPNWFLHPNIIIGQITDDSTYNIEIKQLTKSDAGVYTIVVVKNNVRHRKVLRAIIRDDFVNGCDGRRINLTCTPPSNAPVYWRKDGRIITFNEVNFTSRYTAHELGTRLTILTMNSTDRGMYQCWQENIISTIHVVSFCVTTPNTTPLNSSVITSREENVNEPLYINILIGLGSLASVQVITVLCLAGWFQFFKRRWVNPQSDTHPRTETELNRIT